MGPIQITNHSPNYRNERLYLSKNEKKKEEMHLMQLVRTAQVRVKQTINYIRYLQ